MNNISPIHMPPLPLTGTSSVSETDTAAGQFKNLMLESIEHVNQMQQNADTAIQQLVTGEDINPAEVLTAIQKADMTFRLMLQIRNKMVEAYQQVQDIRI